MYGLESLNDEQVPPQKACKIESLRLDLLFWSLCSTSISEVMFSVEVVYVYKSVTYLMIDG